MRTGFYKSFDVSYPYNNGIKGDEMIRACSTQGGGQK
jgi:hypothetical protein